MNAAILYHVQCLFNSIQGDSAIMLRPTSRDVTSVTSIDEIGPGTPDFITEFRVI